MKYLSNQLAVAALLLSCLGLLVFFEFIRPFRNPTVDVPLSLATWGIGAVFAIISFFLPGRVRSVQSGFCLTCYLYFAHSLCSGCSVTATLAGTESVSKKGERRTLNTPRQF
jgi:hypothetical protein